MIWEIYKLGMFEKIIIKYNIVLGTYALLTHASKLHRVPPPRYVHGMSDRIGQKSKEAKSFRLQFRNKYHTKVLIKNLMLCCSSINIFFTCLLEIPDHNITETRTVRSCLISDGSQEHSFWTYGLYFII